MVAEGVADPEPLSVYSGLSLSFPRPGTFGSLLSAVITVILALPGGVSCSSAQTVAAALQGQVLDPSGAAILRATVTVTSEGGAVKKSETDGQGRYRVHELSPGTYTVRVGSPGFTA
jgi:hypothetical protein